MSRVAKMPVALPKGVEIALNGRVVEVKGSKGALEFQLHKLVDVEVEDGALKVVPNLDSSEADMLAGTTRAVVNNMVTGVSVGFERRLELVGVGYRAQVQGNKLTLSLGYSHPIEYIAPEGIAIEAPTQTEVVIKGTDKQVVGQIAAEIRSYRPPEPYKGKGVKYAKEKIVRKEAKKK
ncbi:MAG: 50S ribosomal protein L6 [Thiotrichales bacterium]